jgi:lipoprotein signal peptidase
MALTALSDVEKIYVKPHEKSRNMLWFFMAAAFLILLDQLTKILVKGFTLFGYHHEGMYLGESHPLIGDVVRLTFVENPGMAFGIQFGFAKIFLTLFSLIAGSALLSHYLLPVHWGILLTDASMVFSMANKHCFTAMS